MQDFRTKRFLLSFDEFLLKKQKFFVDFGRGCTRFLEVNCPSQSSFQLLTNRNSECVYLARNYVVKNLLSARDSEGNVNHLQKRTIFLEQ